MPAVAAPPYREFLDGLRARGYDDTALVYLDQLEADSAVPKPIKDVLDFERAVTLIGLSRTGTDPATQTKRLEEATAALERFVSSQPDHPLVARAQSERGEILLGQARVAITQANSPGNEGKAEEFRTEARNAITKARAIFEEARQRNEQQLKSFGAFVENEDAARKKQRNDVFNALMQSRLHLADCTYREAQSYSFGDPKRNSILNTAAQQYEQIHADYRSQVGGLYARLWMGKCYEEQAPRPEEGKELSGAASQEARQRLNIAEAIYSELLEHNTTGESAAARMQDLAFWFKLIVRNHPVLSDYQLVVDKSSEWLKSKTGSAAQSAPALGVRWERAQALEKLSNRRDTTDADRTRLLRQALSDAEFVNAYPGDYRDVSRAMISRIKSALGRGEGDPKDFDAANGLAQTLHNQIGEKQEAVTAAKTPDEKAAARLALSAHLDEAARILKLALSFAGPGTDRAAVNGVRYRLAYVEYNRDRPYDAAVLADFMARKFKDETPQIALDSAYLTMAAYYKIFDSAPKENSKEFELAKLRETADFIASAFPDSEQANEARLMLGRLYLQVDDYPQAAEWFSKVPASSPQAGEARLLAGRSFWDAYAVALRQPEEDRPEQASLDRLRTDAERFLREGLTLAEKQLSSDATPPDNVVAARLTLAQIVNLDGKYQEAIDLLTGGSQPVTKLISVEEESKRPKQGVQSAAFATLTRQQLLRSYIGLQQIEPAIAEMKALEKVGGEGNTTVFVQLGRQIKQELEGMPAGQQRDAVMAAFDQFLGSLSRMQQGQTYSSLLWIGETYFGLTEAAAEPRRSTYFDRAAASYDSILSRASETGFLPIKDASDGIKLRLAAVEKSRGNFPKAYDLAKQVLKTAPKALNAQAEAAEILRDWGLNGGNGAESKLLLSIQGDKADSAVPVWGWGQIAQRLQRALEMGQSNEEYKELYRKARYEIPAARRAYANALSDRTKFETEIGKAEKELTAYVATTPKAEIGDEWWAKLEELYMAIQKDQGILVAKPLQPATEYVSTPVATDAPIAENPAPPESQATAAPTPASNSSILPIVIGLLLAGGLTAGLVVMLARGDKKQRQRRRLQPTAPPGGRPSQVAAAAKSAVPTKKMASTKPAATATKARPTASEQPLVAKNVRRTKPSE